MEDEDGWLILIDDQLTAWNTVGEPAVAVNENILSLTQSAASPTAMLVTHETFENFHLTFDVQTSDLQSFVLFRFNDGVKSTPERAGYMLSTDPDPNQLNPVGTILNVARSTIPEDYDPTQWNTIEVEAVKELLSVSINGERVAVSNDRQFSSGKIALAVPTESGASIRFKDMKVQKLAVIQVVTELVEEKFRSDTTREWQSLFDGSTLTGWSPVGDGRWQVENEAIHGYSGEGGGFLVSDGAFRNFYLKTQFKIIKEDNSGIFIRKSPDSVNVTITDAIECNIYDHNGPSHAYSTGSIATHARSWFGMIDYDDWNEMEIFAEDDHIVMFVNGRKSSESYLPKQFDKAGNICLQGGIQVFAPEQGPSDVYFKEVMVKSFD